MKKIIMVIMALVSLAFLAGGDNSENHTRKKIEDIAKGLPIEERQLVDTILLNDRRINAGVDVINDISKK